MSKKNFKSMRSAKKAFEYGVNQGIGVFKGTPKRITAAAYLPRSEDKKPAVKR